MLIFEFVTGLLLMGVILALLAERIDAPYPALLALGGAGLALIPGAPELVLDPELALTLFVAPVLLDAAFDASPRDLRQNLFPVSVLALVVVGLTIVAVALVARAFIPDLAWAPAIALGAIVAPPDASAASTVLRRLHPPHRLLVILEGESLFNDASALLVYRVAVIAAVTGSFSGLHVVWTLVLTCGVGVALGSVLARAYIWLSARIDDIATLVLTQFLSTFAVWMLAERLGLSAIVTMVAYAMTLARRAPGITNARRRIATYAVWEVAVFVLNVLAFILIGLQLRGIVTRLAGGNTSYVLGALAVCAATIGVRVLFWLPFHALVHGVIQRRHPEKPPAAGAGLVIAWCGMRGIVTLAAALALPDAFPHRDFIVLAAFSVVLSTLVLQGLSLGPLMARLSLRDEGSVEHELRLARIETARAVLLSLTDAAQQPAAALLRREYRARLRFEQAAGASEQAAGLSLAELQREAALVQRQRLVLLRAESVIGDDAFHAAEAEIDLLELSADGRIHPDAEETSS